MKRILLLDDDEIHLENLGAALESWGYAVTACLNVEQAATALKIRANQTFARARRLRRDAAERPNRRLGLDFWAA